MARSPSRIGVLLPMLVALTACGGRGGGEHGRPDSYQRLDGGLDSLRSAFTADSGKVRAIFLASPT